MQSDLLQDEGYVDLSHIKEIKLSSGFDTFPEEVRVSANKHFGGVLDPLALRIVYGSSLAENRILTFLCPPGVGGLWQEALEALMASIKAEDPRMVWLKDQYLFLYYQDDLCMGPLAADAIKVRPLSQGIFQAFPDRHIFNQTSVLQLAICNKVIFFLR